MEDDSLHWSIYAISIILQLWVFGYLPYKVIKSIYQKRQLTVMNEELYELRENLGKMMQEMGYKSYDEISIENIDMRYKHLKALDNIQTLDIKDVDGLYRNFKREFRKFKEQEEKVKRYHEENKKSINWF
ncbi:MAG: hypothetical protein AAFO07_27100 [Bacteroidota bacterium]